MALFLEANTLAEAAARGLIWLGNTQTANYAINAEITDHFGSYCGGKKLDRQWCSQADLAYSLTLDEFSESNMNHLMLSDGKAAVLPDNAQAASAGVAGDAFNFNVGAGGNAVVRHQYLELKAGGNTVRHASALVLTGAVAQYGPNKDQAILVKDVDYCYDPGTGLVGFLVNINNDTIASTITAPAITAADGTYMRGNTPLSKCVKTGYGRFFVCDDDDNNNILFDHGIFRASLTVETGPTFGDQASNFVLNMKILGDEVGEYLVRDHAFA